MFQPELSDLALPNAAYLRVACIERMYDEPEADWSDAELEVLSNLFAEHVRRSRVSDWRAHTGFRAVCRDMEDYPLPIPKWGCLVGWLAPEGPVASLPELVTDIARRALEGRLVS